MKEIILFGEFVNIKIKECSKICIVTTYDKTGFQLGTKDRVWNSFDNTVKRYIKLGFLKNI